jgi:hypothetical protein
MTAAPGRPYADRLGVLPFAILASALLLLALDDSHGLLPGLVVAVVGLALSAAWRIIGRPVGGGVEVAPVGAAMIYLVLVAPPSVVSEALAGFAGIAVLLWLAGLSARSPGRLGRALDQLIMPMAGFAVALGIAFILPTGPLSLGFASLLLVLVVVLVVLILARPAIVGRREAPSS